MSKKTEKPDEKKPVTAAAAAPEPPPEKPPGEKKPAPTPEEIEERAQEFLVSMFPQPGEHKKPKAEKPPKPEPDDEKEPEKKEPEPELEKKADPEPEKKPEPKKDKPLPPPISEAVRPEQLQPPAPKKEAAAPADEFTDEDQETVAALARMEREGKAPKGIVAKTQQFWKDEQDYITKWQRVNSGEAFNADAAEHAEFYEKNEPAYDERAFKTAVKSNLKDDLVAQARAEVKKDSEATDYERRLREQEPKTAAAVHDAIKEMVAEAGFEDLMKKDGKLTLTKEVEAAIAKSNPAAKPILMEEAERLSIQIAEIDKFEAFPGHYQLRENFSKKTSTGEHILPHLMLKDFASSLENELAALPPEHTMRDGKRFVTQADFATQVDRIMQSPAAPETKSRAFDQLSGNYYTMDWQDIKKALVTQYSERAKARIAAIGGGKPKTPAPEPAKSDLPAAAEFTPPAAPVKAPSVSSASDNVDTTKKGAGLSGKTTDDVVKSMWP